MTVANLRLISSSEKSKQQPLPRENFPTELAFVHIAKGVIIHECSLLIKGASQLSTWVEENCHTDVVKLSSNGVLFPEAFN